MKKNLKYLCLQATQEGQASYAHVHEIIKGLRKKDWNVELFEPSYAKKSKMPGPIIRILEFLIVQIRLLIKIKKGDMIYIRSHFAAFFTSLIAKIKQIPVIQEVNGPYEDLFIAWPLTRYFSKLLKFLNRAQLKWADILITVTPQLKKWLYKETGKIAIYTIPNGANTDIFTPNAINNYKIPKPYVVFFGSLAAYQGINTLLDALNLPEWPEDLKLVIMGDGIERGIVEKTAKEDPKIVYLGRIPYRNIPGIIASSIAGLSPQNNKGSRSNTGLSPLKVYETLACRVPAIVTNFAGQADLIRKYNCGVVISPENPKELIEAIKYLYNNPKLRREMGRNGHKAIIKEHSWDNRAAEMDKILLRILKIFVIQEK